MLWNVKFSVWSYGVRVFCTNATKFQNRIGFKMHICITLCTIDKSLENDNVEFNFMAVFFNEISLDSDHYEFGLSFNTVESLDQECCWIGDVWQILLSHILRDHKNQIISCSSTSVIMVSEVMHYVALIWGYNQITLWTANINGRQYNRAIRWYYLDGSAQDLCNSNALLMKIPP